MTLNHYFHLGGPHPTTPTKLIDAIAVKPYSSLGVKVGLRREFVSLSPNPFTQCNIVFIPTGHPPIVFCNCISRQCIRRSRDNDSELDDEAKSTGGSIAFEPRHSCEAKKRRCSYYTEVSGSANGYWQGNLEPRICRDSLELTLRAVGCLQLS